MIQQNSPIKKHLFLIIAVVFFFIAGLLLISTTGDGPAPPQRHAIRPSGFTAAMLEDQTSEPAQLFIQTCAQCHDLPDPKSHTKEGWPEIVHQMINRLRKRKFFSSKTLFVPGNDKAGQIIDYLSVHALIGDDTETHNSTPTGLLFQKKCTQCHGLPHPKTHSPTEWAKVIERMRVNMDQMKRDPLSDKEADEILRYLSDPKIR